jgi:hypothetical protein
MKKVQLLDEINIDRMKKLNEQIIRLAEDSYYSEGKPHTKSLYVKINLTKNSIWYNVCVNGQLYKLESDYLTAVLEYNSIR